MGAQNRGHTRVTAALLVWSVTITLCSGSRFWGLIKVMGLCGLGVPVDRSTVTAVAKQFNVEEGQSKQDLEESSSGQGCGGRTQGF